MPRHLFKFLGLAAIGGAGYYVYEQQQQQQKTLPARLSDTNSAENAGRSIDKATSTAINYIEDKAKDAKSAIQSQGTNLADSSANAIDTTASTSKGWVSSVKDWITGK